MGKFHWRYTIDIEAFKLYGKEQRQTFLIINSLMLLLNGFILFSGVILLSVGTSRLSQSLTFLKTFFILIEKKLKKLSCFFIDQSLIWNLKVEKKPWKQTLTFLFCFRIAEKETYSNKIFPRFFNEPRRPGKSKGNLEFNLFLRFQKAFNSNLNFLFLTSFDNIHINVYDGIFWDLKVDFFNLPL